VTTFRLYQNVTLGSQSVIEDYCIIGEPPRGRADGALATVIGAGALIRSHTVIYAGNRIGRGFQTGHGALIREENEIGDDVSIGSHSIVEHHVVIRRGARLHSSVFVPEYSILDEECWLGPGVVLTNARYPRSRGVKETLRGAHIMRRAKVGANATLLPGVTIGADALVGAGAVVVEDVPAGVVVAGNPARVIKMLKDIRAYDPEREFLVPGASS
jgi:acetyltransferase-like isoleucine patch superfamily enzyme